MPLPRGRSELNQEELCKLTSETSGVHNCWGNPCSCDFPGRFCYFSWTLQRMRYTSWSDRNLCMQLLWLKSFAIPDCATLSFREIWHTERKRATRLEANPNVCFNCKLKNDCFLKIGFWFYKWFCDWACFWNMHLLSQKEKILIFNA